MSMILGMIKIVLIQMIILSVKMVNTKLGIFQKCNVILLSRNP